MQALFSELLKNVEHALEELADSKVQLQALEELLEGFERIDRASRREIDALKKEAVRETATAVGLRISLATANAVGHRLARAWRKMKVEHKEPQTDDEVLLEHQLEEMGWFTKEATNG